MTSIALAIISAAALVFMYRVLRGPSLPDRAIALDGLLTVVVLGVLVAAGETGSSLLLATVLVVVLASFVATSAVARFIERRGA